MSSFKHKFAFNAAVKASVSEQTDELLALASIDKLKPFLPKFEGDTRDLLPIVANACVIGRRNKNLQVANNKSAQIIAKTFTNRFIDVNHGRDKIVGVILTSGYSEFGTDKPLTYDEVKDREEPFNIVIGGVIWRLVNQKFANIIEDASDPTSDNYGLASLSWELGFNDYSIAAFSPEEKNLKNAEIIDDPQKIIEMSASLNINGGNGIYDDKILCVMPIGEDLRSLGVGITETPAAEVKGIFVDKSDKNDELKGNSDKEIIPTIITTESLISKEVIENNSPAILNIEAKDQKINISENNSSLSEKPVVKKISKIMKLTCVEDITDESLKELKASEISQFINTELSKLNEKHLADLKAKEDAEKQAKASADQLAKDVQESKAQLVKVSEALTKMQIAEEAKAKDELFNQRMAAWDADYDLEAEDRSAIATQIQDMDETAYAAFQKNTSVFLKNKKKGAKASKGKEACATASDMSTIVEGAIDKSVKDKSEVPATISTEPKTLKEKYAKAFAPDQFTVKI